MSAATACATAAPDGDLTGKAGAGLGSNDTSSTTTPEVGILTRVCASGTTTNGVDVSYYNGTINWPKVKAAGYPFAFIRISDGTGFKDPQFAANWSGAQAAGVLRGIYQFFRPAEDVNAQADMVIAAAGTPGPGDLPPVIDVEVTGNLSPATVAANVRTWVNRVKAGTGVDPIVYTGKYFWRDQVGGPTTFVNNPLWIAQYTTLCPDLTPPWNTWAFWQYSESGTVAGMSGQVDMDRFNGTLAELQAMAGGAMPPPSGGGGGDGGGSGGDGGGSGGDGGGSGDPPATTCNSATMDADYPDGTCVQAASDAKWYECESGLWYQQTSTENCTQTFGWCSSATLGEDLPPRSCVQAASDSIWYQCNGDTWVSGVDVDDESGPAGACVHMYPLD
jgi:lysozyme